LARLQTNPRATDPTDRLDPDDALYAILEAAAELTGARYAALGVLDESRTHLERFLTLGIDEVTERSIGILPRGRGLLGALIADPRPVRVSNLAEDPMSYGFPAGHPPMRSFLGVPIVIRGETWGNLYLTDREGGAPFSEDDEDAVVVLAQWAGTAISKHARARLLAGVPARDAAGSFDQMAG
jgi:GAF domain-containing protein